MTDTEAHETHDYQPAPGSALTMPGSAGRASFVSQSTTIEQSRVVAEVQALVVVAQNVPRNEEDALTRMRRSCRIRSLADKAFYDYNRGTTNVHDLTIRAVKEAARCWRNVQFEVAELSQDLANHQSEMLAWAWDMETNVRVQRKKIVPHVRDSKEYGRKTITDFREIGEILGNWAARQLRECIKDILPPWYLDEIRTAFTETRTKALKDKPIEVVRANAIGQFDTMEVSREQLERFLDRPSGRWSVHDIARLRVTFEAIQNGEIRVEDHFPPESLKAADAEAVAPSGDVAERIAAVTVPTPVVAETEAGPVPVIQLAELLAMVGVTMATDVMQEWSTEQRVDVVDWARAEHLHASDNDVVVPDRPACLVPADYVCDVCGAVGMHYQDIEPHPVQTEDKADGAG